MSEQVIRRAIGLCFFASGAAGLVYQVLWARQLSLIFGVTTYAVATVLATFMGGLALGSWVLGRAVDRRRNALAWYAGLELGIGLIRARRRAGDRRSDGPRFHHPRHLGSGFGLGSWNTRAQVDGRNPFGEAMIRMSYYAQHRRPVVPLLTNLGGEQPEAIARRIAERARVQLPSDWIPEAQWRRW